MDLRAYSSQSSAASTPRRPSKSTYLPSSSLALSSLETRLADNDMSETFGLELLTLYGDASSSCSDPIYPPPVLDYIGLRGRYEAAGRRLCDLSSSDQLICRIVFASASRLHPSSSTPDSHSHSQLARQLVANAASHADTANIWRQPSRENAMALLLLYQLMTAGELGNDDAKPYMAALIEQLRTLHRTEPEALVGKSGDVTGLVWTAWMMHTFAALERREAPDLTNREFILFLGNKPEGLPREVSRPYLLDHFGGGTPPKSEVLTALKHDPWELLGYESLWLAVYSGIGRRVASPLSDLRTSSLTAADVVELGEIWGEADELVDYLDEIMLGAESIEADPFALTVFHLYTELAYGGTVFAALALILALQDPALSSSIPGAIPTLLQQYLPRFLRSACQYLRRFRNPNTSFLAVYTGSAWSVSRLVAFTQLIRSTSPWAADLHPGGPADKLETLSYLQSTLTSVGRAYPNEKLEAVLQAVEAEQRALALLLNVHLPSPGSADPA
ncbi:hypothetical protein JCM8097_001344 [Rhodosporidiobolus ruineniae]